ncbi:GNAT family N-acetyltransferase [Corynebacterium cystitidis]|uniref:GNAT family N-acetyltransferase n=1 Tax=Corynebacterium cystitidis TaxID=35757 RepID=UPI00211F2F02|nr:GNAT family N-acetyltransferase [Corynebacterium cystitidis]
MKTMLSVLRLADLSPFELHSMYKLRVDIFVHEQKTPYAEIDDVDAHQDTRHVLAWRPDGAHTEVMGVARIFPSDADMVFGRLVVKPEYRGAGLAGKVVRSALTYAFENYPGKDITLEAQAKLTDYYADFGFEAEGEQYEDTGAPHQKMRLTSAKLAQYILKNPVK